MITPAQSKLMDAGITALVIGAVAQAHEGITPWYRLVSQEGPSHNREFTVEVLLGEEVAGKGHGRNKQTAEQEAAHAALKSRGWI